mmetsp:Transcript_21888/g.60849  ORF Transcript_21888/g.60849 Transcript_21888/m.60849 type:complete len:674 (+) Transcript_21888:63-2084(+)
MTGPKASPPSIPLLVVPWLLVLWMILWGVSTHLSVASMTAFWPQRIQEKTEHDESVAVTAKEATETAPRLLLQSTASTNLRNSNNSVEASASSSSSLPETTLIRCVGTPGFNETCLFRNMYWIRGDYQPVAVVLTNSTAARQLRALSPIHLYGTYDEVEVHSLRIRPVASPSELQSLHDQAIRRPIKLTAAYSCLTPHNIGHGIWDCVWPLFVGLNELGILSSPEDDDEDHDVPFQPIMLDPDGYAKPVYRAVRYSKQITAALALLGDKKGSEPMTIHTVPSVDHLLPRRRISNNPTTPPSETRNIYHMELFAWGSGHRGQRNMNLQYKLPGSQYLQSFRDRTLKGFGLPPASQPAQFCLNSNDSESKLNARGIVRVSIFENKRYSAAERRAMFDIVRENQALNNTNSSLDIRYISWTNHDIVQQIKIISQTDVYVSGPGTGLMFSPLARDGSVVVNLGQWGWDTDSQQQSHPSYMEEYLVAGAAYQRGLLYDRCANKHITKDALWKYIRQAERIVRSCENYGEHRVDTENQSPIVTAFRELFNLLGLNPQGTRSWQEVMALESNILQGADPASSPCTWAELLVFETRGCRGIWDKLGWNETDFRQTIQKLREKHGLTKGDCGHLDRLSSSVDDPKQDDDPQEQSGNNLGLYTIRLKPVQYRRKSSGVTTRTK